MKRTPKRRVSKTKALAAAIHWLGGATEISDGRHVYYSRLCDTWYAADPDELIRLHDEYMPCIGPWEETYDAWFDSSDVAEVETDSDIYEEVTGSRQCQCRSLLGARICVYDEPRSKMVAVTMRRTSWLVLPSCVGSIVAKYGTVTVRRPSGAREE